MTRYRDSLHKCKSCKRGWIAWMIPESFVENFLAFPVSKQSFQVLVLCQAATHACHLMHWNLSGSQGKVFWQSTFNVRVVTDTSSRNSWLCDSKCCRCGSGAGKYRATCRKRWRTTWEHDYTADVWKKVVNHTFFFYQRKFHRILWLDSKD